MPRWQDELLQRLALTEPTEADIRQLFLVVPDAAVEQGSDSPASHARPRLKSGAGS